MLTIHDVMTMTGATLARGDKAQEIQGVASLTDALAGDIAFFGNPKYLDQLKATHAGVVLVPEQCPLEVVPESASVLVVENPSASFGEVAMAMRPAEPKPVMGVHPSAVIDPTAQFDREKVSIASGVVIGAGVQIGDGTIIGANTVVAHGTVMGENCHLWANVSVRERSELGNRVVLHHGVVIGGDGFGYELVDGRQQKVDQIGIVRLDDDVEVGANSTIDRARFGRTWIQEGTKIDNLVQIGHNCVIGKHCVICAQTGVAGSAVIGDYCTVAAQAGVAGHLKIGDQAVIMARGGVTKDLPGGEMYMGFPAQPVKEARRDMVAVRRVASLNARVKQLERQLADDNA
ncbi:UDP-3-O-(3-hydroxymyristoyl)glucosamine N-acyltransferase [Sulfuriroseicoccus oceanibius]|uniref:UDP-3-O-acylglucosamine N-acyltransferase n=1 Tax=Sulfuriroseicoccus oceanibius TaxID=2707525 RepID=A0A7T7F1M8_9BACT|nr:UDP-3-O-(3-hydroxymyristoyl)glucosamine N-acyltransferase [Sulfuriroseicoccus oceanibius]QQL44998.1 UDP-3-O-(3-hydroxymyristoyl)glucosamine N-acyltransferase [Sulfuriroseicoccus oceanibius]